MQGVSLMEREGKGKTYRVLALVFTFLLSALSASLVGGCGGSNGEGQGVPGDGAPGRNEGRAPDIVGTIEAIAVPTAPHEQAPPPPGYVDHETGILEIRAHPSYPSAYQAATVTVTAETEIYREENGEKMYFSQLRKGMLVKAWFEGPVTQSMPVRARAEKLSVVE